MCICNEKRRNGNWFFYVSLRAVLHMDVNHLPLTLTQPYVLMTVFAEKNGVCTVSEWWLSTPYTIKADTLGASFIRWVLFWEPLVHSPPSLPCKQVLLGEHQVTFTSDTLKSEYTSHSPACSQGMEEQNTSSISGLLLVKYFPNLAFSGAFSVSRRVKNAHKQMKSPSKGCVMEQRSWPVFYWSGSKSSPGGRIAALVLQQHFVSASSRTAHGKAPGEGRGEICHDRSEENTSWNVISFCNKTDVMKREICAGDWSEV